MLNISSITRKLRTQKIETWTKSYNENNRRKIMKNQNSSDIKKPQIIISHVTKYGKYVMNCSTGEKLI